jgi:hypothetical protein
MRIPQPKINTSLQPKVKYDKFSLSPQMVIPLPFGFGKQTPSEIPNSEITDPIRNVPARPKLNLPHYNPFVKPVAKPELGPFTSERYDDVQEVDPVNQQGAPEFLFNSEKLFNSFNRPKQKPLLPVVIPAKKLVVKTEKYTKPEVEELPWYEEAANAVTNTLKGFYDDFAQSVEKSPLDFRGMNFGSTGISPQGATEMTRDLTKRGLSLFSPDMAEKYNNWINRQQAIKNMDQDPKSSIIVPKYDFAPMYVTGDTIPDAGNRQYHIPESMDVDALRFGVRNRGDLTPLDTEAASITAFHPFVNSKTYFADAKDDPANATYLAYTPDGKIQVGERKDFENKDVQVSRVFSNKVVDFIREPSGSIKKVPAGAKVNKNAFSPAVTVLDDQGKQVQGKLNLVVPQGDKADEAFGIATGGRFIFKTPDGQTRLVSGSLKNIEEEFKRIKGKNPYVTVVSLDNGSYSRGLRTRDQKLTAQDLRSYDNLNHGGGGNFAYLLPGQETSRPLAKFKEFEQEATKKLQALYPGKKVSVGYQNTGLYDQSGGRDIQSQVEIQKKGNSQTSVSLHNFDAAKDYVLYVDGKPIDAGKDKKIYKDVLWGAADKTGMYHLEDWDVAHIGLAKEGQKTAFDELKAKYPEIFTNPNFVKSLEYINKNKSNPLYQEYHELLNNIQPFTGQPRITEFEKRKGITKKAYGGPILDPRGQWAHPGKVTRIPGSDITMQGVNYPVLGIGNNGKKQMMYPGQEYNFGGASYVDEYPMMQIGGTLLQPITAQDMSNVLSLLSVPQKAITKLVTGKYQTPSEAMDIKNPYGAFATDAVLDPVNLVGAGLLGKAAQASTKTGILSNTYKINPFAFKPNPQAYYHRSPNLENIINRETGMLQGFGQSKAGKEFTEEALKPSQGLNLRRGANSQLYFSKGVPLDFGRTNMVLDEKTGKMIPGQGYKGPYVVEVKDVPMGASTKGRAPGGEPTKIGSYAVSKRPVSVDESKFYQEDWLRGYKQVKIPNKKEGGQILNNYPMMQKGGWSGGGLWDTDKVAYLDSTVNANRNLEFIRRAVENDGLSIPTPKGAPGYGKGMTSSHLMTYDPKSRRSYPELVNINGTLKYLTGDDAYNYAEDTGEYIQFPTAEQANYFSQNYKKSNYVKVGKQPLEKKHGIKVTYKK